MQLLKSFYIVVFVFVVWGLFAGCDNSNDVQKPPPRPEAPKVSISGTAFDGLILEGNVTVYAWDGGVRGEVLGTGTTDLEGEYNVEIPSPNGPVLICVNGSESQTGGRYVEEASGNNVYLLPEDSLCAVQNYSGSTLKTSLTYFTNIAFGLAEYMVSTGMNVSQAINQANQRISTLLGIDVLETVPLDITSIENATAFPTQRHKYGLATASISQYMSFVSDQNEDPEVHDFFNSILFAKRAFEDIRYDGVLNGQGEEGMLSLGVVPISSETYRHALVENLFAIIASNRNKTGLDGTDIMEMALGWNNSNDTMFGGTPFVDLKTSQPGVTNLSIEDGQVLSATVTVSADITDVYGLADVSFSLDGNELAGFGAGDAFTYDLDTSLYTDGDHTLSIAASNLVGGSRTIELNVTVANELTTIANVNPVDGSYVRGEFTMSADVSDPLGVDLVDFYINGNILVAENDVSQPSILIDSTALDDGDHAFSIKATNTVNFEQQVALNYTVDNTPPVGSFTNLNDGDFLMGVRTLRPTVSDNLGLAGAQLLFDGELLVGYDNFTQPLTSFNLNTTEYADSAYTIAISVTDKAGNNTVAARAITIDNTPPAVAITSPTGGYISQNFSIAANVTDAVGVTSTEYYVDNTLLSGTGVDVAQIGDGAHTIKVTATDGAGHSADDSVNVVVDTAPPVIVISNPADGSLQKSDFQLVSTITDTTPLVSTQYKLDNATMQSMLVSLASLNDGSHVISVSAEDSVGLSSTEEITVITDKTPPTAVINSPAQNAKVQGIVAVTTTVSDALGLASVEFSLDGSTYSDGASPSFNLDTTMLDDGNHSITVVATDNSGYTSSDTVDFVVSNPPPMVQNATFFLTANNCYTTMEFTGSVSRISKMEVWMASIPPAVNTLHTDITSLLADNGNGNAAFNTQYVIRQWTSSFSGDPYHTYLRIYNNVGDWWPSQIYVGMFSWNSSGKTNCWLGTPNSSFVVVP